MSGDVDKLGEPIIDIIGSKEFKAPWAALQDIRGKCPFGSLMCVGRQGVPIPHFAEEAGMTFSCASSPRA